MWRLFYNIIRDFGTFGVVVVQFMFIGFIVWKFATNHWRHLTNDVKEIKNEQVGMKNSLIKMGERISTVEGQLK